MHSTSDTYNILKDVLVADLALRLLVLQQADQGVDGLYQTGVDLFKCFSIINVLLTEFLQNKSFI